MNTGEGGLEKTRKDYAGAKLGMWVFLFTEMMLFAAPLFLFLSYRYFYPTHFHRASRELDIYLGSANTLILLTSSLFMAMGVGAMKRAKERLSLFFLYLTAASGAAFLIIKAVEWSAKIQNNIYPGSMALAQREEAVFFGLYYFLTGMHALHVFAGVIAILSVCALAVRKKVQADEHVKLENAGLYWHLVDIVWIFLFPLFYLA